MVSHCDFLIHLVSIYLLAKFCRSNVNSDREVARSLLLDKFTSEKSKQMNYLPSRQAMEIDFKNGNFGVRKLEILFQLTQVTALKICENFLMFKEDIVGNCF